MKRISGLLVVLVVVLMANIARAEVYAVVFKAAGDVKPDLYTFSDEDYKAKKLPADTHAVLTKEEIAKLAAGETLLLSERMPKLGDLETAWGMAFTKAPAKALYDVTMDYGKYTANFSDVLECEPFKDQSGVERIVYIKKKASINVSMTLDYHNYPGTGKEWKLAEPDKLNGYSTEQQEKIKKRIGENDFKINSGGWYFVESANPVMGPMKTIIVRDVAVKLGGLKGAIKGPKALKRNLEKEMPDTMKELVKFAEKYQ